MTHIRFHSARSLFEAFPEAAAKIAEPAKDEPPLVFARGLAEAGKFGDAVTFCAYLLPRRESVWWACRSVRALLGGRTPEQDPCLLAAEAWARKPDDEHRQAALEVGAPGDGDDPATWLARGAGWAGGMLVSNPKNPIPVPHYMTARASRIAVLLSARFIDPQGRLACLRACVADAAKLAETGL
jgi:hypothetical protein